MAKKQSMTGIIRIMKFRFPVAGVLLLFIAIIFY